MKMEEIECSETSAHKIQTEGNHPKQRIQPIINQQTEITVAKFEFSQMC